MKEERDGTYSTYKASIAVFGAYGELPDERVVL